MKKIILLWVLIVNVNGLLACDYCNCYLGLNPHYKKNSVGLRYNFMSYTGSHNTDAELASQGLSKNDFWETRSSIELHGQLYPTQKLQLIFSLPYVINKEGLDDKATQSVGSKTMHDVTAQTPVTEFKTETVQGIGDAIMLAHYQVFNKTAIDSNKFSQRLFAGGGIKLPVGAYKIAADENAHERLHKPGTGSWDVLASMSYLGKIKKVGLNLNISYMLTTANSQDFEFGNRFNANFTAYYQLNCKKTIFYPSAGVYLEQAGMDKDTDGDYLHNSGGNIVYAHVGFDFYFKKISMNAAYQLPVVQTLNQPQPEMNYRIVAGINYIFN